MTNLFKNLYKKGLVLSPHTDDGELGAGATIARFLEEDVDIQYLAFCAPLSNCVKSVFDR